MREHSSAVKFQAVLGEGGRMMAQTGRDLLLRKLGPLGETGSN